LRILHLSHEGLPDWRIEKSAISASSRGHEVIFGGRTPINYNRKIFSKIYEISWTAKARLGIPFYWHSVKKQIEKIVREVKPDIVHAHNLFSAKMISEFELPFVYDDHEYWSTHSKLLTEMKNGKLIRESKMKQKNNFQNITLDLPKRIRRMLINYHAIRLWTNWEKELVSSSPTITVSDKIAEDLRVIGNTENVFVVPNFPMKFEVEGFEKPHFHSMLSSIYAGGDGHNKEKMPNRNIDSLTNMFNNSDIGKLTIIGWKEESSANVNYTGFLSRQSMYNEMFRHSIGLIPWKNHWSHTYVSPNKAYEYPHAGLFVMCTSSFKTIQATLKENCATFHDYGNLESQLHYFKDNLEELYKKRVKIFEFAQSNLLWEHNEENILRAYQLC
jgi:hypothetical protein